MGAAMSTSISILISHLEPSEGLEVPCPERAYDKCQARYHQQLREKWDSEVKPKHNEVCSSQEGAEADCKYAQPDPQQGSYDVKPQQEDSCANRKEGRVDRRPEVSLEIRRHYAEPDEEQAPENVGNRCVLHRGSWPACPT